MIELTCIIVDDEELARTLLENYISRLPFLKLVATCTSPIDAMHTLQDQSIDLIFSDIQMPEMLGTDLIKTLSHKPMVVFTTAYSQYAVEGYELNVVDYLLKPFRFERFMQAVNKACDLAKSKNHKVTPQIQTNTTNTAPEKKYVFIKSEHKVHRVLADDILYIQSMREYVTYYTKTSKYLSLGSLKQLAIDLPEKQFIRVHKSFIVAKPHVATLEGNLLHIAEEKIPIGASYKEAVLKELF